MHWTLKQRRAFERLAVILPDMAEAAATLRDAVPRPARDPGPPGESIGPLLDLAEQLKRDSATAYALIATLRGRDGGA